MKKILNLIVFVAISIFFTSTAFAKPAPSLSVKPTPKKITTLTVSAKKTPTPTPTPTIIQWKGNGTVDGLCSDLSYEESIDPGGMQEWLFILTSPAKSDKYELTVKFDYSDTDENVIEGERKSNGAVHFIVKSKIGAKLTEASAEPGTSKSVLTVSHCTHPVKPLEISKSAETYYQRDWDWTIEKTVDGESEMDYGVFEDIQVQNASYDVKVTGSSEDSGYKISGTVTIANPLGNPDAEISSIYDVLDSSGEVSLDCDVDDFSETFTLSGGEQIDCTYDQDVNGTDDKINTVTVTTSGFVKGGTAEAHVIFDKMPTDEYDECITVSDTYSNVFESQEVCSNALVDGVYEFDSYNVTFGKDQQGADVVLSCGRNKYVNTASFVTNDSAKTGESSVSVLIELECPMACSYSQGYWFAKPNVVWPNELSVGGYDYNQDEGRSIFSSSNAGGITDAKKGFLQYGAIMLSAAHLQSDPPSELEGSLNAIVSFLDGKAKLEGNNIPDSSEDVRNAADAIASWIDNNHCQDDDYKDYTEPEE